MLAKMALKCIMCVTNLHSLWTTGKVASVDIAASKEFPVALGIFTFYSCNDRVYSYPQCVNYKHLLSIVPVWCLILYFFY